MANTYDGWCQAIAGASHGSIDKVLFINNAGQVIGSTAGFSMDAAEAKRLGDIFTNKSDPRWESLYTDGITAGGERFVVYRFMDEKTDIFAKKGKQGLVVKKFDNCSVVFHYPDLGDEFSGMKKVEELAAYYRPSINKDVR